MIKTEEVDSTANGLYNNNNIIRNSAVIPPLPPLSNASSLHHYAMITPTGTILSDFNSLPPVGHQYHHQHPHHQPPPPPSHYLSVQSRLPQHHAQHLNHHHLEQTDEKPNMSYLNRLQAPHDVCHSSIGQDMLPPTPASSSSPLHVNNKSVSPLPYPNSTTGAQIHDFNTASTIKYCSSNGLEILPVQSQHAYVIQQCPPAQNRNTQDDHQMDTNVHHQMHQTVLTSTSNQSSANHGSSGGQLEVVHYAGAQTGTSPAERKKDAASPISSSGSRSPSEDQLPPDTTKKSNNTRRPEKPNMSYINMIACAIKESPDRMLTLNGIYNYLQLK